MPILRVIERTQKNLSNWIKIVPKNETTQLQINCRVNVFTVGEQKGWSVGFKLYAIFRKNLLPFYWTTCLILL